VPGAFDFVVAGAASAGCVVASRLAEDPHARVLLLEASPPERPPEVGEPLDSALMFGSAIDRGYETVPQQGLGGRTVRQPHGRLLGGTSNLHGMMHMPEPAP
jgi:choline dehydrogenase